MDSYKLNAKRLSLIHWICWSKSLFKSQLIHLHRIRILKAYKHGSLHEQNCLQTDLTMNRTIPFNPETFMRIRSRKKSEFRSHEWNHLFDLLCLTYCAYLLLARKDVRVLQPLSCSKEEGWIQCFCPWSYDWRRLHYHYNLILLCTIGHLRRVDGALPEKVVD